MTALGAIVRRELLATFGGLPGWTVVALFLVPCGLVFSIVVFRDGGPTTLRELFQIAAWTLLFVAPAITMRSVSDELRMGTWELLAAAPIGDGTVVLGKFAASVLCLAAMILPLTLFGAALALHGRPDWGEIACALVGLLLLGTLYAASGILASTVTQSQLVAYLLALFGWLTIILCARLLPARVPEAVAILLEGADPLRRVRGFTIGLLDTAHIVWFLAVTAALLAGSAWSLRARRCA